MYALTSLFSELLCYAKSMDQLKVELENLELVCDLPQVQAEAKLVNINGQAAWLRKLELCQSDGLLEIMVRPLRFRGHLFDNLTTPTFLALDGQVVYKIDRKHWSGGRWLIGNTLSAAQARAQIIDQLHKKLKELELVASVPKEPIAIQVCTDQGFACCYADIAHALPDLGMDRSEVMRLLIGEEINGKRLFEI